MNTLFRDWTIPAQIREIVTFAIAVLGAALGIINLWLSWRRERLRLKVIPKYFFGVAPDTGAVDPRYYFTTRNGETVPKYLCVDVINKGIATTVTEVGFLLRGTDNRLVITHQFPPYRIQIPFRLEPHSSVTVYADAFEPETFPELPKIKCAYATVASRKRFTGRSQALRVLAKYSDVS